MIFELRHYVTYPGKLSLLLDRFRDHTCKLFEQYDIANIGYWTYSEGDPGGELWYIIGFKDEEHRRTSLGAFSNSEAWKTLRETTEKDGPLIKEFTIRVIEPADFSAIR